MEFIALDLETTGLDPGRDEIIEVGLAWFTECGPGDVLSQLVRPSRLPPPGALAVTGIDPEELSSAPPLESVLPNVLSALAGRVVVAHNAPFDRAFLAHAARRLGLEFPRASWVDTLALARAVWPARLGHSLAALKRRLGLDGEPHRAGPDALAAGRIFLALLEEIGRLSPRAREALGKHLPEEVRGWLEAGAEASGIEGAFARLERLPGFDRRPGQRSFARAVLSAFQEGGIALLEAGPGTGKTYGYLVPLLLHLAEHGGRAVVATRTRALQEQLWRRDLPTLLQELSLSLPVALLKGRENYLCLRRLEEARLRLQAEEFLGPLLSWAGRTRTGDLEEVEGLWGHPEGRRLISEVRDVPWRCGGTACPFFRKCPSRRARERAREAALVVVNHALLGADLAIGGRVLGEYDLLVVDEAHGLPDTLRDAFSPSLSPTTVPRFLGELRRGKQGLLSRWRELTSVEGVCRDWRRVGDAHRALWASLERLIPAEPTRYTGEDLRVAQGPGEELSGALLALSRSLEGLAKGLPDEEGERARAMAAEAAHLAELVRALLWPGGEEYVFWSSREQAGPTLHASPVELAGLLAGALWPNLHGAVLTSATLAVGGGVGHLVRELGIPKERAFFRRWPSPFPYDRVRAFVTSFLPHPDDEGYPAALASLLRAALQAAPCRALALFTSRRLLAATREHLAGLPLLSQGEDGEGERLISAFRAHPPPVLLLGLDTLWEGVDLPGEELEMLFITRLPFPVPTDPLAQAQAERIRTRGEDPFWLLFLPRAVLKLRQGAGRLVRSPEDRGAIVITDPRAVRQRYGKRFLEELPVPVRVIDCPEALPVALKELFG